MFPSRFGHNVQAASTSVQQNNISYFNPTQPLHVSPAGSANMTQTTTTSSGGGLRVGYFGNTAQPHGLVGIGSGTRPPPSFGSVSPLRPSTLSGQDFTQLPPSCLGDTGYSTLLSSASTSSPSRTQTGTVSAFRLGGAHPFTAPVSTLSTLSTQQPSTVGLGIGEGRGLGSVPERGTTNFSFTPLRKTSQGQRLSGSGHSTPPSSPAAATSLNDDSKPFNQDEIGKFQELSKLIGQLCLHSSQCRRIQRGSPGAGALSASITPSKEGINRLKPQVKDILDNHSNLAGVAKLKNQYDRFDRVLNETINERGYEDGYTDRVQYLERMNYESGQMKGMLDTIIEGAWETAGNDPIARVLTFVDDGGSLQGTEFEDALEAVLNTDPDYQHGDIAVDINRSSSLCSNLLRMMEESEHCDVTFCIGSKRVHAHRVVLAAQSEYFSSLLFGSMKEARPNCEIKMTDIALSTFQILLRYAYCGCVELRGTTLQGVLKLLEAADRFSFLALKDALAGQLSTLISVTTVIPLFLSAHRLNLTALQEACFKVVDKHAETILEAESLLTLPSDILVHILDRDTLVVDEPLIRRAVMRWMKENEVVGSSPLVQCIRLSEIPLQMLVDLADLEPGGGMFTERDVLNALKIQMKPYWEKMRPRGRMDVNKNFFKFEECAKIENTVAWRSRLQPNQVNNSGRSQLGIGLPTGPSPGLGTGMSPGLSTGLGPVLGGGPSPGLGTVPVPLLGTGLSSGLGTGPTLKENITFHGQPNIPLCNAILSSNKTVQRLGRALTGPPYQQEMTVVVALDNIYLVNLIQFDPYPLEERDKVKSLGFSYTVEISTTCNSSSSLNWRMLLDYSRYTCYSKQNLLLPTVAVRYIRFKLCSVTDCSVPFTLAFTECLLRDCDVSKTLILRDGGISVPKVFVQCNVLQDWSLNEHEEHQCKARLSHPFRVKMMKFKLDVTCASNTVGDIMVHVNNNKETTKTLSTVLLKSSDYFEVILPEDIILTVVNLKIANVVQGPLSSSPVGTVKYFISEFLLKAGSST